MTENISCEYMGEEFSLKSLFNTKIVVCQIILSNIIDVVRGTVTTVEFIYLEFYITFHTLQVMSRRVVLWAKETIIHYLGFYVAFNTVQVISRWVVGRAEETRTYSWLRFCNVNC